jgi:hypothetical protein
MAQAVPSGSTVTLVFQQDIQGLAPGLLASANQTGNSPRFQSLTLSPMQISTSILSGGPMLVVLNQAYDDSWTAYQNGVRLDTHIKTLGFSNGWIINTSGTGRLDITFSKQPIVGISLTSEITGIIIVASLSGFLEVRHRKKTLNHPILSHQP